MELNNKIDFISSPHNNIAYVFDCIFFFNKFWKVNFCDSNEKCTMMIAGAVLRSFYFIKTAKSWLLAALATASRQIVKYFNQK